MAEYYELDYGQMVLVKSGRYAGMEGIVTRDMPLGYVGIDFSGKPSIGKYEMKVHCSDIEILSREDSFGIVKPGTVKGVSGFEWERIFLASTNPGKVLREKEKFSDEVIGLARSRV